MNDAEEPPQRAAASGPGSSPGPRAWHHRTRDFVKQRSRTQKVGGVAAVALVLSAPFGGLEAEPPSQPSALHLGRATDIGPFDVTIEKVLSLSDLAPAVSPAKGDRLLVVEAKVHNPHDTPQYVTQLDKAFYGEHLGVVAGPGESQPTGRTFVVADASSLGEQINPGLAYEVAIVFEQEGDWRAGTGADRPVLGLNTYAFQADDPLTLDPDAWILDHPLVQGPVDVEVKQ